MNRDNIVCHEMPLGLGMALSRNISAMERFSEMSVTEKNNFIEGCKKADSKEEMQDYVNSLNSK